MDWLWISVVALFIVIGVVIYMFAESYETVKPKPIDGIPCPPTSHHMLGHPDRMIHPLKHQLRLEISDLMKCPVHQLLLYSHSSVFVNDSTLASKVIREVTTKGQAYESFRYQAECPDIFTADGKPYHTRFQTLHRSMDGEHGLKLPGLYSAFLKDLFLLFDEYAKKKASLDMKRVYTLFALDIICKSAFNFEINGVAGSELGKTLYNAIITINEAQANSGLYPLSQAETAIGSGGASSRNREKDTKLQAEYSKEELDSASRHWKIFLETIAEHIRYQAKTHQESYGELDHANNLAHALVGLTTLPREAQAVPALKEKSDQALICEIHQIIKHSQETLTSLFMWITVSLFQNKKARKMLQKSIVNHHATKKAMFPEYLEDFIKETLRIHPPAGNMMVRTPWYEDYKLNDSITIPKGTPIHIHMHSFHNTTRTWKKPNIFNPDRWQEFGEYPNCPFVSTTNSSSSKTNSVYDGVGFEPNTLSYFPFSAGSRSCLGKEFVLKIVRIFLKQLVSKYLLEPTQQSLEEDNGVSMNAVIVPVLSESYRLRVIRIKSLQDYVNHGLVGLEESDLRSQDRGWANDDDE